jgi:hypothetical protein
MKFNVPSKTLYNYVSSVSKVINSKNALAILNNFLFVLDDNTLTITASDLENRLTARVPVTEVEGNGSFCIDARRLVDLLKEMPDQGITFNIDDNTLAVEITYPSGNYNLIALSGNEYPSNNNDDEDIEILIESAARHDLHSVFFDCFHDYEKCVSGAKDANGNPLYNTPNLKGKLHTYISSQQLTKKQRNKLGSGDWLFDNSNYWDLNIDALLFLKEFLKQNLK